MSINALKSTSPAAAGRLLLVYVIDRAGKWLQKTRFLRFFKKT